MNFEKFKSYTFIDWLIIGVFVFAILLLAGLAGNAQSHDVPPIETADDSGIFYDPDRDGEGIVLTRNGNDIVFYFYTYHPNEGCWNSKAEGCNDQRWFVSGVAPLIQDSVVTGQFHITKGMDFHPCTGPKITPEASTMTIMELQSCYEIILVGDFLLTRNGDGWNLQVSQKGDFLPKNDPIYTTDYTFDTPLLKGTD